MTDVLGEQRPLPPLAHMAESNPAASGSIVQVWTGTNISKLIQSPELNRTYRRWATLIEKKLPRLNEILGPEQEAGLNNAMLLLRVPGDFLFVHHGIGSVRTIGTNFTGQLHSERKSSTAEAISKVYTKCADAGEPFYIRFVSAVSQRHFCLEQIVLPIAADERREVEFLLVYSAALDDKNDILKLIFERSEVGMIAAAANHDEAGSLQDGRILLINARARTILKLHEPVDQVHTVRDLGPWFRDGALWEKTNLVSESGRTHVHYRDLVSGTNYRVTVEPLDRFVLFNIIEIPVVH